jgi:UDP-N-acetylglucosamine--N-acetylmuramyl-(pentapeptide) pyrophosphoryl-undecaprenol N-acetylglucosamine transferase
MKIVIIGGHLSPAIALIDEIKDKKDILFIGRKYALEGDKSLSLEYKVCQEKGIGFAPISAGRLQRKLTRYTISAILKIPVGIYQALRIMKKFNPDVVVGFGGYVSFPVVMSAFILRIPIVIHEQTLEAGLSNKIESIFANKICISFERSRDFFPKNKTILTGNPVRPEILNPKSRLELPSENIPLIYVTGGSLGSVFINSLIEKNLKDLLSRYRVIHQTGGANNFESLNKLKDVKKTLGNDLRKRYLVSDHFSADEAGSILREATLVIGRAGINTITELMFLNKPAILIPLPVSQRNEQFKNAMFLKDIGLAQIIPQNGITNFEFLEALANMTGNIDKYKANENKEYLKENAGQNILRVVENAARNSDKKAS